MPKTSSLPGSLLCGCPGKSREDKHLLLPEWRDMSTDIGEPKIYNILETRGSSKPPRAFAAPSCLHAAVAAVRIQMGHIHSGLKSSSGFALNLWGSQ